MMGRLPLIVVGLAALAVAGAVVVLSGGDSAGDSRGDAALHRAAVDGAPSFATDAPPPRAEPRALVDATGAEPGAEGAVAGEHALADGAARPAGPTRSVSGRILRASDNTPIGGVAVEGHGAEEGPPSASTLAADDGTFHLQMLPLDATRLTLKCVSSKAKQDFPLPPGKDDLVDQELVFDSGFRIAGLVTDAKGSPLPGAHVDAENAGAVTGSDGRFVLRDVCAGDAPNVKVAARAPLHTRETADVLVPPVPSGMPEVELKLIGAGRLAGRVTQAGQPSAGAAVEVVLHVLVDDQSRAVFDLSAECADDGSYELDHVPAGNYLVQAQDRSSFDTTRGASPTAVPATGSGTVRVPLVAWISDVVVVEDQTTRLDVALPEAATLGGRVLDDGGTPVAGASVDLRRRVRWPAPGMNGNSISISNDVTIETKGSGDGKGEATLSRAEGRQLTDARGRYEFTGLGPGERVLSISDPTGRLAPAVRDVELHAGEHDGAVDFVLSAGLTLRARVTDPLGHPLAGARAFIVPIDSHSISDKDFVGSSDEDGWIEAHGLSPGEKRISMSLKGYAYLWDKVDPSAPPRVFVMTPAPKLRGVVVDASTGDTVPAFALKIVFKNNWMQEDTQPHPGGAFEQDIGDDSHCTVTVDAPGYEPLTLEDLVPSVTAVTPAQFRLVRKS